MSKTIEIIKGCRPIVQDFDETRFNPDKTYRVYLKVGKKIEDIKNICDDLENKDNSVIEMKVTKYDDEIKFKIYWDVPKDCYKVL